MFQYLLPVTSNKLAPKGVLDRSVLARYGLDDVLRDVRSVPADAIVCDCQTAGGHPSVVLSPIPATGDIPETVHYDAKLQQWQAYRPAIYMGDQLPCLWAAKTPTPTFLARHQQVPGYTVEDPQRTKWMVPAVRGHANFPAPYGAMPCDFDWTDEGEPTKKLAREFQRLWEDVGLIWDHLVDDDKRLDDLKIVKIVTRGLQVNYRIGPHELRWLAANNATVITTQNLMAFAQSLADVDSAIQFREAKKKEESQSEDDGSASLDG